MEKYAVLTPFDSTKNKMDNNGGNYMRGYLIGEKTLLPFQFFVQMCIL